MGKEHDMTATRELTEGQLTACQIILDYHKHNPWIQDQPPIHRLGVAFGYMMSMLDMEPAELSAETGVEEQVIERMEWWGETDKADFVDVMNLAHFFDISLEQPEETLFGYKGQRFSWR